MSIDQSIACRTRPSFPDDLPSRAAWTERQHKDFKYWEHEGGSWLIHVAHEDNAELRDEIIAEAFEGAPPPGACLVGVTLEPVTRDTEAIALLNDVIALLERRCGGVVLAV